MKKSLYEIFSQANITNTTYALRVSTYKLLSKGAKNIDSLYEKYYSDIDRDTFDRIINADPTTKKDMGGVKMGKYCKWLLKLYKKEKLDVDSLERVSDSLEKFHKLRASKNHDIKSNIEDYHSLDDLDSDIEKNKDDLDKKSAKEIKKEGSKVIYDQDGYKLRVLKTIEAAILYSKGTTWCTGAKNNNRFREYTIDGYLFILYVEEEGQRYQIHFSKEYDKIDEVRDEENDDASAYYEYILDEDITPVIEEYVNTKKSEKNSNLEQNKEKLGLGDDDNIEIIDSYENFMILHKKEDKSYYLIECDSKKPVEINGEIRFEYIKHMEGYPIYYIATFQHKLHIIDVSKSDMIVSLGGRTEFSVVRFSNCYRNTPDDFVMVKNETVKLYRYNGSSFNEIQNKVSVSKLLDDFTVDGKLVFQIKNTEGKYMFEILKGNTMIPVSVKGEYYFDKEWHLIIEGGFLENNYDNEVIDFEDFEI